MGAPHARDGASSPVEHAPGKLNRAGIPAITALQHVDSEPRASVVHYRVRERDG